MIKFISLIIFYFVIIFSVIGYGKFFSNYFFKLFKNLNYGYQGLIGIFFLIIYSYISSYFYAHSLFHNTVLVLIGFLLYLSFNLNYQQFYYSFTVFAILFISIIIFKTHDDFPYYHFAYSYNLTQNNLFIGLGNLNHGFRTPSSIFYLNSLFYLPLVEYYFFHLASILILGFVNIVFLNKTLLKIKKYKSKIEINYIFYFSVLSILFINIFFYRIAEHGTDRSAQIIVFLFLAEIFFLIEKKKLPYTEISILLLLLSIIITLKAFYILYVLFSIPVIFFLYKKYYFQKVLVFIFQNKTFYTFLVTIFILFISNFLNTGCLIYPVHFTCYENVSWAIPNSEVHYMNDWYEQWSKAGAGPNFRVNNPDIYIQNFNWVSNWVNEYFFNKVSDFLLGLIILSITVFYFFYSKPKKKGKLNVNKYSYLVYCTILLIFFEWFYNHPSLRYGGYVLLCAMLFFPLSIILSKSRISINKIMKRLIILLVLVSIIFLARNIKRINEEIVKYKFNPVKDYNFRISEHHYRLDKQINNLIEKYNSCEMKDKNSATCKNNSNFQILKINSKYVINR